MTACKREVSRPVTSVLVSVVLLAAAGVAALAGSVPPPAMVLGETRCANSPCQMIIKQAEHAAGLVTTAGEYAFCDIGCLLVYMKTKLAEGEEVRGAFVRDWPSQEWTEAREATFVRTDIRTPMRYGLVAFRDAEQAERHQADHGGDLLTLQEATHYVMTERAKRMGGGTGHGS